jgi:hypothetical protein
MEVFMSIIKKFLLLNALVGAVLMPTRAYTQQANFPGGNTLVYAGITAVVAYIFYSWGQQAVPVKAQETVQMPCEREMYQAVLDAFKPQEDPYVEYLERSPSVEGRRLYLQEDQDKMVALFENLRIFVQQVSDRTARENLLTAVNDTEQELRVDLLMSSDSVDPDFLESHGARAADAVYYTQCCHSIIQEVVAKRTPWLK